MTADGPGPEVVRVLPQRRCVVCQQTSSKRGLIRLVRSVERRILMDRTGKAQGRGAYVCGNPACVGSAALPQRLAHSLRLRLDEPERRALMTELAALMPGHLGPVTMGVDR